MSNEPAKTIYLPLEQPERAARIKVDELLPREVYERLSSAISGALDQLPGSGTGHSFDELRVHNAVLLDGERGAGKTTVLVNLREFLKTKPEVEQQVHVLKPVDPTLLEDGDSLFLNVVVAAVLSDERVKKARECSDYAVDALSRAILRLGEALENRQTLQRDLGLDRLRAFVGSQELTLRVHEFFEATLKLIGAKLLVLPIDDVDTSLGRAFENLEVVRRYLGTPLVLAIVCGDMDLYADLVWRDFYQRMQPGSCGSESAQGIELLSLKPAVEKSKELGQEYLRKLFPAQLRCQMPGLDTYLANADIVLGHSSGPMSTPPLRLPLFHAWLTTLLRGPVNGIENSDKLAVPLSSARSLFQLLNAVKSEILELHKVLNTSEVLAPGSFQQQSWALRRALQMPGIPPEAMQAFEGGIQEDKGRQRPANQAFSKKLEEHDVQTSPDRLNAEMTNWIPKLLQHWKHDAKAGPACLVLQAQNSWRAARQNAQQGLTVLETPLFRPKLQQGIEFRGFNARVELDWQERLKDSYPDKALSQLPKTALLPFATPELGRAVPKGGKYFVPKIGQENTNKQGASTEPQTEIQKNESTPLHCRANLLTELMLQRGFYSTSNQTSLINVGRLLELIVMSVVADVYANDIHALLTRAPFHSMTDLAPTKPVVDGEEEPSPKQVADENDENDDERSTAISALVKELNTWRTEHAAALGVVPKDTATTAEVAVTASAPCRISPWLIYCVLNKVLNQAEFFNRTKKNGASLAAATANDVWQVARTTFNAFWAALGSFEKGPLFGLPAIVAVTNISSSENFEKHSLYLQNIAPFASEEAKVFGKQTRSLTAALRNHPLRILLNELPLPQGATKTAPVNEPSLTASKWLLKELGSDAKVIRQAELPSLLGGRFNSLDKCNSLKQRFEDRYPRNRRLLAQLNAAMQLAFPLAK